MKKAIVRCTKGRDRKGVLFMMRVDDERYGTEAYEHVTAVVATPKGSGVAHGVDGGIYKVFPDWSVRYLRKAQS